MIGNNIFGYVYLKEKLGNFHIQFLYYYAL